MWPLHDRAGVRAGSGSRSPHSGPEARAPSRGPAAMYLALTNGEGEVADSQRTVSRCTLAILAIVLYALATPLFWTNAAHAKAHRQAPHATLTSKDHGSDSHDGEGDDHGDGGPDPHGDDKAGAPAASSNTGASAQSNNPAAPSNTSANANSNSNSAVAVCPAQASSNTGAQASSNTGAQASSNTGAQASSNTGAQASSNTGAQASSNTGAQASSNTGAQATAKVAHAAKAHAKAHKAHAKAHKANATASQSANSNTGVSAASANSNTAASQAGQTTAGTQANCPPNVVPPVNPPVVNGGPNTTPVGGTPTAPVAAPQSQPAASGVAGVSQRSARASIRAQRVCATRSARVTMAVANVRRVVFSIDGRRVRTVNVAASARRVSVALPLRASGPRRQTVTARVTFRNGTAARTLRVRVTRCAAVRPQFTG
jgi:hypothetical protein